MAVIAIAAGVAACSGTAPETITTEPTFASPLDEFFGQAVWDSQEAFQRAVDEFDVRREELVAACMRDAGFDYLPDLESFQITTARFDELHPNDLNWVSQYGFGIVSGHRSVGTMSTDRDHPNREYVESLSETAREAWEIALNGPPDNPQPAWTSQADFDEWMRTNGCRGYAIVQAQSESPIFLLQTGEFAPLFDAKNQLEGTIRERPEMAILNREWANCMADVGLPGLGEPRDATGPLATELFITRTMIQMRREDGTPDPDDGAALLADIQRREIEMALADFDCRQATNYDARVNAIRLDVETQFVSDNRALLEDFRNAAEMTG